MKFNQISQRFSRAEVNRLLRLYFYDGMFYGDVRSAALKFLSEYYPDLPEDTWIVIQTMHNGNGGQWGILLIRIPRESGWHMVGEFGHALPDAQKERLVLAGFLPQKDCPDSDRLMGICKRDVQQLVECFAEFDPMKEFFGRARIQLADLQYKYIPETV
ncbi:MAG: hypothetical protein AAB472_00680 [Patescibacteria group bacterium]